MARLGMFVQCRFRLLIEMEMECMKDNLMLNRCIMKCEMNVLFVRRIKLTRTRIKLYINILLRDGIRLGNEISIFDE